MAHLKGNRRVIQLSGTLNEQNHTEIKRLAVEPSLSVGG